MEFSDKIIDLLRCGGEINIELAYNLAKSQHAGNDFFYLLRFGGMIDFLRSYEQIEILEFDFKAPRPDKIEEILNYTGVPLDKELNRFYNQCDGMSVQWRFKDSCKIKNNWNVDGMFNVSGIEDLYKINPYLNIELNTEIVLYGTKISKEEISKYFHRFDESPDFEVYAYSGSGFTQNPILFISDESASYLFDSRAMHITSYLDLLLHSCGSIDARKKLMRKYNGYKLPVVNFDSDWFARHRQPDFSIFPPVYFYPETRFYKNVEF